HRKNRWSPLIPGLLRAALALLGGLQGAECFIARLRQLLSQLARGGPAFSWSPSDFSAHSLRLGQPTAAANAFVSVEAINGHGKWHSEAIQCYVRRSGEVQLKAPKAM
ncbi:hypothetical protein Vretifemale_9944, partial [Volvox reticuliferus]